MSNTLLATSDDGTIEYVMVSKEHYDGIIEVMNESFFAHENVCQATGVNKSEGAKKELETLTFRAVEDGVSIVAIDKQKNKLIAGAFNKMQEKDSREGPYFENFVKSCKYNESKSLVQYMIDCDGVVNIFELVNIDCLLEIMFLTTLSEYRGKGIARKLCELTIELARKLLKGENVKRSPDGKTLPIEPIPRAITAIFTANATQKIGKSLNFKIATRISYEKFFYDGKSYASIIGKETPSCTIEYLTL